MDILWAYLDTFKDSITGQLQFGLLSKIAKLIITLPHSNADEERVFSFIRQNKTDFQSSLSLTGTLLSLFTVKMAIDQPCHKFEPTNEVIKQSKRVTWEYNKEHKKS